MNETKAATIIRIVLAHYPAVQGIYLFGSHGTQSQWPASDVDIALLLPPEQAKSERNLALSQCRFDLEERLHKPIDLLNLRRVSTVMQKEIIGTGSLIYLADRYAVEEFEMLVLSFYQKLNEERAEVLAEGLRSGRFYDV
ncbi:MAG: nucleotidyltransferase domain-containing protein [Desulforhabdus sp.]|jgi:predicted nucleotidyltransferase|nr:nucleotidyltransferase domain-containing protein [Desulforhabdus sp.]